MDGGFDSADLRIIQKARNAAVGQAEQMLSGVPDSAQFKDFVIGLMVGDKRYMNVNYKKAVQKSMAPINLRAREFRRNSRALIGQDWPDVELLKSGAVMKADLDVGTLTNFAQITGGQTLGYVSLDTQMARGTVRPDSFTLYQALNKSAAFQVVDYWPSATDTGGGLPGTAFQGFGNVATGTLNTNAGIYGLNNITLKLAVDGRSITTALAAQNSFVDVTAQENINASLTVLSSENWTCYWGNPNFYPNQFAGLNQSIPAANHFDFQTFMANEGTANGWTSSQSLFNMIYQVAGQLAGFPLYGRPTHAFMTPVTAASLQSLVTTILNNITTKLSALQGSMIEVNGDLRGMKTRFGDIQFPMDLFISAREIPAQAIVKNSEDGTTYGTLTAPTRPVAVTAAVNAPTVAGSAWTAAYAASSGVYSYAVASMDSAMNESTLTWLTGLTVSGVAAAGSITLTIQPPAAVDAAVFRVYRSGLGYTPASSGAANPASVRYIGEVLANGSSNVTFVDLNTKIPGSETIFMLDLDERDEALDFRYLLPLTRVELFAQNLYMPWAVCMIGSIRNRIPKFHAMIKNFVPDNIDFNPLKSNPNAT